MQPHRPQIIWTPSYGPQFTGPPSYAPQFTGPPSTVQAIPAPPFILYPLQNQLHPIPTTMQFAAQPAPVVRTDLVSQTVDSHQYSVNHSPVPVSTTETRLSTAKSVQAEMPSLYPQSAYVSVPWGVPVTSTASNNANLQVSSQGSTDTTKDAAKLKDDEFPKTKRISAAHKVKYIASQASLMVRERPDMIQNVAEFKRKLMRKLMNMCCQFGSQSTKISQWEDDVICQNAVNLLMDCPDLAETKNSSSFFRQLNEEVRSQMEIALDLMVDEEDDKQTDSSVKVMNNLRSLPNSGQKLADPEKPSQSLDLTDIPKVPNGKYLNKGSCSSSDVNPATNKVSQVSKPSIHTLSEAPNLSNSAQMMHRLPFIPSTVPTSLSMGQMNNYLINPSLLHPQMISPSLASGAVGQNLFSSNLYPDLVPVSLDKNPPPGFSPGWKQHHGTSNSISQSSSNLLMPLAEGEKAGKSFPSSLVEQRQSHVKVASSFNDDSVTPGSQDKQETVDDSDQCSVEGDDCSDLDQGFEREMEKKNIYGERLAENSTSPFMVMEQPKSIKSYSRMDQSMPAHPLSGMEKPRMLNAWSQGIPTYTVKNKAQTNGAKDDAEKKDKAEDNSIEDNLWKTVTSKKNIEKKVPDSRLLELRTTEKYSNLTKTIMEKHAYLKKSEAQESLEFVYEESDGMVGWRQPRILEQVQMAIAELFPQYSDRTNIKSCEMQKNPKTQNSNCEDEADSQDDSEDSDSDSVKRVAAIDSN